VLPTVPVETAVQATVAERLELVREPTTRDVLGNGGYFDPVVWARHSASGPKADEAIGNGKHNKLP